MARRVSLKDLAKKAPEHIAAARDACLAAAAKLAKGSQVNREAYLHALTDSLRPLFDHVGHPIPATVAVSVGFPSRNALSATKRAIGQCWAATVCEDGETPHIFLHPELRLHGKRGMTSAADHVLAHELIHAACPHSGHRGNFARCAHSIGLEGKMTATHAGHALHDLLTELTEALGPWPGQRLNPKSNTRKKPSRMLLMTCLCPDRRPIRVSRSQAERGGYHCELCGADWILDGEARPGTEAERRAAEAAVRKRVGELLTAAEIAGDVQGELEARSAARRIVRAAEVMSRLSLEELEEALSVLGTEVSLEVLAA